MGKTKIFVEILRVVSEETEIASDEILSKCRRAEVVDAKCILAHFLFDAGLNANEIAPLMRLSDREVRRLNQAYGDRLVQKGNLIAVNSEAIRKRLGQD